MREAVGVSNILGVVGGTGLATVSLTSTGSGGSNGPHHPPLPGSDKIEGFHQFVTRVLQAVILGGNAAWISPYLAEAGRLAAERSGRLGVRSSQVTSPAAGPSLAASELGAIVARTATEATRAMAHQMGRRFPQAEAISRDVTKAIKAGAGKSKLAADYLVSKVFTHATVEQFRAAGISKVGVEPERYAKRVRGKIVLMTRDKAPRPVAEEDVVEVVTAGDDLVCEECQDISDGGPYYIEEAMDLIPAHPNAVLEGTTIASYGAMHQMVRAKFRGPAIYLRTGAKFFAIGPNHPMLTRRGWRKAYQIEEGDELLYDLRVQRCSMGRRGSNFEQAPMVENVFEATPLIGTAMAATTAHDLHGDRIFCEGEVDIVCPARSLLPVLDSCGIEHFSKGMFKWPNVQAAFMSRFRARLTSLARVFFPTSGLVSIERLMLTLSSGHLRPFDLLLFACGAPSNASTFEDGIYYAAAGSKSGRQCKDAGAFAISDQDWPFRWDRVLAVHVREFSGWAFDGSTSSGLYNNNGYIVHNCRCALAPSEDAGFGGGADFDLGGMLGGLGGAAAGLGAGALLGALLPGEEEEEEPGLEPEEAEAEEEPEDDFPEIFSGTTADEYIAYVQRWLEWADANDWPSDLIQDKWDEESAIRVSLQPPLTPEQANDLLEKMEAAGSD